LIGSHVAQFVLHLTDTVMLGWYGVLPLAAGVLGASSFFTIFVLGSGFAKAVMPMVASANSQGDERQVRRVARMGLWLSILFSALTYPVFWWSGSILLALGQEEEVSALAQQYLRIAGLGMCPALLVMVLKSYLSALAHAGRAVGHGGGGAVECPAELGLDLRQSGSPRVGRGGLGHCHRDGADRVAGADCALRRPFARIGEV
jgi:Na+-driven multidrug efflux pump